MHKAIVVFNSVLPNTATREIAPYNIDNKTRISIGTSYGVVWFDVTLDVDCVSPRFVELTAKSSLDM